MNYKSGNRVTVEVYDNKLWVYVKNNSWCGMPTIFFDLDDKRMEFIKTLCDSNLEDILEIQKREQMR